jgi:hypothetical protein
MIGWRQKLDSDLPWKVRAPPYGFFIPVGKNYLITIPSQIFVGDTSEWYEKLPGKRKNHSLS